ncbi:Ubiquinol oxidase 4, chloroplastic/chromoplastic [Vitis vinifera]|uniref:Ubiquinol oxidase n=1 Tax=Vitis vinifera TaxID=29760 RepID=A0A438C6E8_VITVI|nr:Ubiquinol oxidase 4, chloroplastic/chromoplastic [Vitis vinifera]
MIIGFLNIQLTKNRPSIAFQNRVYYFIRNEHCIQYLPTSTNAFWVSEITLASTPFNLLANTLASQSFMSVLHMYESFGWWRRADYLKVHFAESWNEMHHLLIMESYPQVGSSRPFLASSLYYFPTICYDAVFKLHHRILLQELGGNAWWFDRFLAQHIAIFYYFMTVFMYVLSPRMAYSFITHADHLSECVESHAYETYDKFIKSQGDELKNLPAPEIAVRYYTEGDLYLFDEFQTARAPKSRRPKIENLYDVFLNIRDDEAEHCKTMKACQTHGNLRSPHSYPEDAFDDESGSILPQAECEGIVDCIKKSVSSH